MDMGLLRRALRDTHELSANKLDRFARAWSLTLTEGERARRATFGVGTYWTDDLAELSDAELEAAYARWVLEGGEDLTTACRDVLVDAVTLRRSQHEQ